MDLGLDEHGRRSWQERMLALRDRTDLGPFRLAYLEALVRAADVAASRDPGDLGVERG
jgi:CRISPR-associated endonuclease/helicase Cas3